VTRGAFDSSYLHNSLLVILDEPRVTGKDKAKTITVVTGTIILVTDNHTVTTVTGTVVLAGDCHPSDRYLLRASEQNFCRALET